MFSFYLRTHLHKVACIRPRDFTLLRFGGQRTIFGATYLTINSVNMYKICKINNTNNFVRCVKCVKSNSGLRFPKSWLSLLCVFRFVWNSWRIIAGQWFNAIYKHTMLALNNELVYSVVQTGAIPRPAENGPQSQAFLRTDIDALHSEPGLNCVLSISIIHIDAIANASGPNKACSFTSFYLNVFMQGANFRKNLF